MWQRQSVDFDPDNMVYVIYGKGGSYDVIYMGTASFLSFLIGLSSIVVLFLFCSFVYFAIVVELVDILSSVLIGGGSPRHLSTFLTC